MIYRITHKTTYDYAEPAITCQNVVHLTPRDLPHQRCMRKLLTVQPTPQSVVRFTDCFGNAASAFDIDDPHSRLTITVSSKVEVDAIAPPALADSQPWETVRDQIGADRSDASLDAYQYVFNSPYIRKSHLLRDYAKRCFSARRPILDAAMALTSLIHAEFKYVPNATTLATSIEEVLEAKHGVCQDFAHLEVGCLRSLGLPARYVSGYLRTDPPPGKPRLIGADASHAWVDVFCPKLGWVGFDPTNNSITSDRHIVLAFGRDYGDVSPIKGVVLGGGEHRLTVSVDAAAS